ncbi:hypothetical protein AVEN_175954-1 [Araneus ventricosus]|uniref:RING-type domain-containing protein n=1 Tax=Araneus ventricosus TaxID=182803 RepID=A0A4Y2AY40_ARAVE|nr:hypothetical protein AVEN_22317-1 [Araneus ventricosus]GBL83869.1 hypothetical protein AVEN_175954-1 [Araneus ventricosus]
MYQKEFVIEFFEVVLRSYTKFLSFPREETIEEAGPPSTCVLCSKEIFSVDEFKTPCDHVFHDFCVKPIFKKSKMAKCPICERLLTKRDVAGLRSLCGVCLTAPTWFYHCDKCEEINILYQKIMKDIQLERNCNAFLTLCEK